MYFYISFLRPPPKATLISTPIPITPQVTNDLRTEFLEDEIDIHYAWTSAEPSAPLVQSRKLTTWRGSASAYKPLTVLLPQSARPGQLWKLVLFCPPATDACFRLDPSSSEPIGVTSMPVVVLDHKTANAGREGKQDEIERTLILPSTADEKMAGRPRNLVIRERTSFDLDKKIWDSGLALSSWFCDILCGTKLSEPASSIKQRLLDVSGCCILELGTGTCLVSLVLSSLLAGMLTRNIVIATDLPSAIPLIEHNITFNNALFADVELKCMVLDWNEPLPANKITSTGPIDVIIMSDVTYNVSSFPSLLATLQGLLELPSDREPPLIILAYKERDPAERDLWKMAEEKGIIMHRIAEVPGHQPQNVELWLGHFLPVQDSKGPRL